MDLTVVVVHIVVYMAALIVALAVLTVAKAHGYDLVGRLAAVFGNVVPSSTATPPAAGA